MQIDLKGHQRACVFLWVSAGVGCYSTHIPHERWRPPAAWRHTTPTRSWVEIQPHRHWNIFAFLTCPHIQARTSIPHWAARTCPAAWSPCWARGSPAGSWTEGSSCPGCCQASCDHQLSFRLDPWVHQKPAKECNWTFFVSNYLLTWDSIGFSYIYIFTNVYIFVLHTFIQLKSKVYMHPVVESAKCWLFYQVRGIIQNACYCLFSTDLNKIFVTWMMHSCVCV